MGFPSKKEIKKVLKELENVEGTLGLGENPTPLEKLRWDLCQNFIKYLQDHGLKQKELAELIGVDEGKMSKILRHRIDEFSTDRLIELYTKLEPNLKLNVG